MKHGPTKPFLPAFLQFPLLVSVNLILQWWNLPAAVIGLIVCNDTKEQTMVIHLIVSISLFFLFLCYSFSFSWGKKITLGKGYINCVEADIVLKGYYMILMYAIYSEFSGWSNCEANLRVMGRSDLKGGSSDFPHRMHGLCTCIKKKNTIFF
jgi:hypothetical protein